MENDRIINEIRLDISKLLVESLGISIDIERKTEEICSEIKKKLKTIKSEKDLYGNLIKEGKIEFSFNNNNGLIIFKVINFLTENQFDESAKNYCFDGYIRDNNIYLTIAMYNGMFLSETFGNTIQHELSHFFDKSYYKSDSIFGNEKDIYKITKYILQNDFNETIEEIAKCVYISFKTEQIANSNGLYNLLKNGLKLENIKETNEYKYLFILKKVLKNFDDYKYMSKTIYKKEPKWLKKRLEDAYYNYVRRIGRIISKIQNENDEIKLTNIKKTKTLTN